MTSDEWWLRWCVFWYAVGWRAGVERENFDLSDVLNVVAALMMRIGRLEALQTRPNFFGLF